MERHLLISEGFERASGQLTHSLEAFSRVVGEFAGAVSDFNRAVERLKTVEGMKAENEKRASQGLAQAYGEDSFFNV